MSRSPSRKRSRQCVHFGGGSVTLNQHDTDCKYKWLEEYYCAKNLELHMPDGIKVPDLDQIPEDIASPAFIPELLGWDGEGSEGGEGIIESAYVSQQEKQGAHL
ncbi:hypothetical protein EV702DRAFT_1051944 [Suillus placidus]|uniref:Uncharacterized protein n=1 Tax=Suillus placidus TaxID=48579 RepID=A0A9P6ZF76_9AGAM|nr:hypothetical protein EV702DRAFT_1051944 [Suillus placidus]